MINRVLFALVVVAVVFGSLLTFPQYIVWLPFVWLGLGIWRSFKGNAMWPWLVACVVIVVVKQPGYTLGLNLFVFCNLAVATIDWRSNQLPRPAGAGKASNANRVVVDKKTLAISGLVLLAAAGAYFCTRWFEANTSRQLVADDRPIACLGDSLTDFGYPQELAKLLKVPVADFGVNGIKTDDGIKMIPEILGANPQLVVLELGGHDYNSERKPRLETKANLQKIIESFQGEGIAVVLVEIPRGFVTDPYRGMERELAADYDLQLIDDSVIRSFIFNSPILPPGSWLDPSRRYSDDGLHPNELGNKHFAKVVSRSLAKVFGDSICR